MGVPNRRARAYHACPAHPTQTRSAGATCPHLARIPSATRWLGERGRGGPGERGGAMPTVITRSSVTAVRISAGEASEVTRSLHAAYARERIEEVIRAVVEDALSPSRIDVLPWHDEIRFEDDLTRAIQEIADGGQPPAGGTAHRSARNGAARARRPARCRPALLRPRMTDSAPARVVIVGGGFAGVACARKLASSKDLHVTLIDKNDYHQFQPLLYQVATSMLAGAHDRLSVAQDRGRIRGVRREAGRGRRHRSGRPDRDHRHRRDLRGGLHRPGRRLAAELLRDAGRRARLPALLAR